MQYEEIVILTGASKGLGLEMLKQIMEKPNTLVVSVSRTKLFYAVDHLVEINLDLTDFRNCEELMATLSNLITRQEKLKKIMLINNAARLGEIKTCINASSLDVAKTIFLNTTVPILLQNKVLQYASKHIFVEVLHIISGAANKAYHGWGAYCTSKAGLLMATKTAALEISNLSLNAKAWALIPGVIDTGMQEEIRNSNVQDFQELERFVKMKSENMLISPVVIASFISKAITDKAFANGEVYNIKDYLN
jgi:benzil reductase ((S)-benzoin forming)